MASILTANSLKIIPIKCLNTTIQSASSISSVLFTILPPHPLHLNKSTNVDAIDSFTNDLVIKKTLKWELFQEKLTGEREKLIGPVKYNNKNVNDNSTTTPTPSLLSFQFRTNARKILQEINAFRDVELSIDVQTLNQHQVDHLLTSALSEEKNHRNFYKIIDQCLEYRKIPSNQILWNVLEYFSESGDLEYTRKCVQLCSIENPILFKQNCEFQHLTARCLWQQGNSDGALDLLKLTYLNMEDVAAEDLPSEQIDYRPAVIDSIRHIFRLIVEETIGEKSEAVLVSLRAVAKHLSERHGEHQVLAFIWKSCFLSQWFSDQQMANGLFDQHDVIRDIVGKRTSMLTYNFLQDHNTDAVHRLIESLLKFEMKTECKTCLSFLFEYQYWRRDLRACSEIIRSSLDIDCPLSDAHNQKLLNLLLGNPSMVNVKKIKPTTSTNIGPKFELKF